MDIKKFKEELLTYCKNVGLDVGWDCATVALNYCYCVFRFNEYDLEYRTCCASPSRKRKYNEINENFLLRCKYIADVWAVKLKKHKIREKLFIMRQDFETTRIQRYSKTHGFTDIYL